ncbi:MAG TPA: hypothetical protein VGP47_04545 [Parachlamydiaceae bacterium]|nr:hypothetical protein [Parachlamydiaceae bacterium]
MKNKLLYLILSTLSSFSFANAAYCQPTFHETCWTGDTNEYYNETPAYAGDCGIYDAYRYITLGTGPLVINPNVGIGYRERYARLGWDSAVSFSTIGYLHQFTGHVVGHYYFNASRQNSPYVGLGLMVGGLFGNHKKNGGGGTLSADFVFGKELERSYESRQFIEMHVGIPTLLIDSRRHHSLYFPLMYIKYGFSF